ncbi:MAG: hypothetical protein H8D23_24605 [Candidatus Brocadiales bacterium]|nr:hypothetical protein [Candidatus Brocadiales bacterium]
MKPGEIDKKLDEILNADFTELDKLLLGWVDELDKIFEDKETAEEKLYPTAKELGQ